MKVAYIAGPYRASTPRGILENIRRAEAVAIKVWQSGDAAICPHMNTRLFDGLAPDSVWLDGDLEILKRCDYVVMVPGWETSSGSREEKRLAESLGMVVIYA